MSAVGEITGKNIKPDGVVQADSALVEKISSIKNNEMYQRIDAVIFNCVGQSLTWQEILQKIKTADPTAYEYVVEYSQQILNPTYVLS